MTSKELKLQKLEIELNRWGDNQGKYTGTVQYVGASQETKITMDALISEELLKFIGPLIHKAAAKVTEDLQVNLKIALDNLAGARQIEAANLAESEALAQETERILAEAEAKPPEVCTHGVAMSEHCEECANTP